MSSIWLLAFSASRILQEDMTLLLGEQQFSTVSVAADAVNDDFNDRMHALQATALQLDTKQMGDPSLLQRNLEQWPLLQQLFNGGLWVTDAQGTAIASVPTTADRVGVNYADRDYMSAALIEGKFSVGSPVIGRKLRAPVFAMATPVRDASGKVIGSLVGGTTLSTPNFLDKITRDAYGISGGYIIVEPKSRRIVTATDKSRIMELLPKPGINKYVDRNIAGYEGYSVLVNALGEEQLAAVKKIPAAGWYMLLGTPSAEAFAPIGNLQMRLILATLLLTVLAGGVTWWILKRQLSPLVAAANAMGVLSNSQNIPPPLPITSQDEIGTLIGGFNHLIKIWTAREAALTDRKEKLELAANVFTHALEGIFIADRHHVVMDVNAAFTRITGYSRAEALGCNTSLLNSQRQGSEFFSDMQRCVDEQGSWSGELWVRRRDGEVFPALQTVSVVRDSAGVVQYYLSFVSDITERKEHENELREIAHFDSLTKLPNRVLLADRMQQAMLQVQRRHQQLAVVYLDLDGFKEINDHHGHDAGDQVLIALATRMKQALREGDTLARIGGDEFVAILIDLESPNACIPLLTRLLAAAAAPVQLGHIAVELSASLGVAIYPQAGDTGADHLLRQSDQAMYLAKVAGKNRYHFFDAEKDNTSPGP